MKKRVLVVGERGPEVISSCKFVKRQNNIQNKQLDVGSISGNKISITNHYSVTAYYTPF